MSLSELAHHWYEAGGEASWQKAVDYAARAAAAAMDQLAYEEAARLFRMALESLPLTTAEPLQRWRLLHYLAVAQYRAGLIRDSLRSCVDAARIAGRIHRGDLEARSVLVIQDVADKAVHPTLQALCESALASIGDRYPARSLIARTHWRFFRRGRTTLPSGSRPRQARPAPSTAR